MLNADIAQGAAAIARQLGYPEAGPWDTQTLGITPGLRVVVEYALRTDTFHQPAETTLIGKFYADTTGAYAYRVMRELSAQRAQNPTMLLATPLAFGYDRQQQLLIQQRVPGIALAELLKRAEYGHYLRLVGQAVAELHALPLRVGRSTQIADHLNELIRPHPRMLAEYMPIYRERIEALLEQFEHAERSWGNTLQAAPIHRDLHVRQLFYGQERIWLIDWDYYAKGDPALDVGNFLVYLQTHLGSIAAPASHAFLEGYAQPDVFRRVPLNMALMYLRLACKRYRLKAAGWEPGVAQMLLRSEEYAARNTLDC